MGVSVQGASPLPGSTEDGKLQPFPVAIHVFEPNRPQPLELSLYAEQLVRGVFIGLTDSD